MKDYLGYENDRSKRNAKLYEFMLKKALGPEVQVMVGHHIAFEFNGDLNTENEIPSPDTLLFDHDLMSKLFRDPINIMSILAKLPCERREAFVASVLGVEHLYEETKK